MQKFALSNLTSSLVGAPYRLGGADPATGKQGFDCATLILAFAERSGMPMPKEWEGFTLENYADFYRRRPEQAREVLVEWACEVGEEIQAGRAFAGDLMVVRLRGRPRNETPNIVIHAGQDQVVAVFEGRGVSLAPIRAYTILKALRWRKKRQPKLMTPRKVERMKQAAIALQRTSGTLQEGRAG